jgi:hypothetical protein
MVSRVLSATSGSELRGLHTVQLGAGMDDAAAGMAKHGMGNAILLT